MYSHFDHHENFDPCNTLPFTTWINAQDVVVDVKIDCDACSLLRSDDYPLDITGTFSFTYYIHKGDNRIIMVIPERRRKPKDITVTVSLPECGLTTYQTDTRPIRIPLTNSPDRP